MEFLQSAGLRLQYLMSERVPGSLFAGQGGPEGNTGLAGSGLPSELQRNLGKSVNEFHLNRRLLVVPNMLKGFNGVLITFF